MGADLPSTVCEKGSLSLPIYQLALWSLRLLKSLLPLLPSLCRHTGIADTRLTVPGFRGGSGAPNSGVQVCTASMLPAEHLVSILNVLRVS